MHSIRDKILFTFNYLVMNKLVVISFLLLSSFSVKGQTDNLRNEILNYTDTNALYIHNGRKMLIDKLIDGDVNKVRQIKNSLLLAENEKYLVFYPYEIRLLLYSVGEYDELQYYINSYDQTTAEKMKLKIKPAADDLETCVLAAVRKNRTYIENDIRAHVDNAEERDFLILNLRYLVAGKDYPDITRESLNADADTFLLKHPDSKYTGYTREYIRYKMVTSNWGFGLEVFSGYSLGTGNLYNNFHGSVPFGMALDVLYKNWSLYLRNYIGIGTTHADIAVNGTVWPNATKANTFIPEATLGYMLPLRSKLHISPFAGVGGLMFSPTESQKEESYYDRVGELGSFAWIAGVNMDIKLGKNTGSYPLVSYNEEAFWFLRIRYGYVMSNLAKLYPGLSGNMHYLTIGVGAIGRKVKRDL
jgi:hypothetical protein